MRGGIYRRNKNKASSWRYFFVGIVLLFVIFKWGLPLFIDVLAGPNEKGKVKIVAESVPPIIPQLSAIPEATFSSSVVVEGFSDADVEATVLVNDQNGDSVITDKDGAFSLRARLEEGENRIQVKAKNKDGKESSSVIKIVVMDSKPLDLTIESPKDGSQFLGKNNQVVEFRGKVSKSQAEITINGAFARVGSDGKFSLMYRLNEGDNDIVISGVDTAGNRTEKKIRLNFGL